MWNKRKLIAVFIFVVIAVVASFSLAQASSTYPCSEVEPGRDATGVSIYTKVTASDCNFTVTSMKLYEEGGTTIVPVAITGPTALYEEVNGSNDPPNTFDPDEPLKPNTKYLVNVFKESGESPMQDPSDEWEFTTGAAPSIGGLTYPNRTTRLLVPWMALAALGFSLLGGGLALRKRMS